MGPVARIEIREGRTPLVTVAGADPSGLPGLRPSSAAAIARRSPAECRQARLDVSQGKLVSSSKGAAVTNFFSQNKATRCCRINKSFPKNGKTKPFADSRRGGLMVLRQITEDCKIQ